MAVQTAQAITLNDEATAVINEAVVEYALMRPTNRVAVRAIVDTIEAEHGFHLGHSDYDRVINRVANHFNV